MRTRQHKTLAASPTTERMPILTGSGASFLVPVEGTVASPDPEQFRHTWELQPLKFVRMADGRLDPTPLATLDIYVGRSAPFLWMRSEEHTSELQSLMRISYAVFCLKKKTTKKPTPY